jgi:hypothetical protein
MGIYQQGYVDAMKGAPSWGCPYPDNSHESASWHSGYEAAKNDSSIATSLQSQWVTKLRGVLVGTNMPIEDALVEIGVHNLQHEDVDSLISKLDKSGIKYDSQADIWLAR